MIPVDFDVEEKEKECLEDGATLLACIGIGSVIVIGAIIYALWR